VPSLLVLVQAAALEGAAVPASHAVSPSARAMRMQWPAPQSARPQITFVQYVPTGRGSRSLLLEPVSS